MVLTPPVVSVGVVVGAVVGTVVGAVVGAVVGLLVGAVVVTLPVSEVLPVSSVNVPVQPVNMAAQSASARARILNFFIIFLLHKWDTVLLLPKSKGLRRKKSHCKKTLIFLFIYV